MDFMGVMDDAIEDGIGSGRIADMLVPVFYGELTGDDHRGVSVAVLDDFQKVSSF